jgi:hypothetical protein
MANNSKDQERLQKDKLEERTGSDNDVSSTRKNSGLGEQTEKASNSRDLSEKKDRNRSSEQMDRKSGL